MLAIDKIFADMSPMGMSWLVDALHEAMYKSDNEYVDPEYQEVQDQVGLALWQLARLVEAETNARNAV